MIRMQDYVIGIDIGGTNIKAGAVDYKGSILARARASTEPVAGSEAVVDKLLGLVTELKEGLQGARLKAIGFGIPGAIRFREGVVTQAPNLPAWDGLPMRQILQDRMQAPCFIDNDANAVAVGEMWVGAGSGHNHVVCLTLGTGVGGGVIIDGELLRGADGMAAELGHISVQADGPRCNCGSRGCLETYTSATGILRMFREAISRDPGNPLASGTGEITTAKIYNAAKQGSAMARDLFAEAGRALGVGMASLVDIFNPEVLIIGGGVAAAWDLLVPPAVTTMMQRAFKAPAARVKVERARLEDDAGICGSAYIAWDLLQHGTGFGSRERSLTPWGFWQVIEDETDFKAKRIFVNPGHRLSYQRHKQREETWMIASGEAIVTLDGKELPLTAGQTVHVARGQAHRIANPGSSPLVFFEVQRGTYFGEDDIERLEDDYKRN
jgi:glucokinase